MEQTKVVSKYGKVFYRVAKEPGHYAPKKICNGEKPTKQGYDWYLEKAKDKGDIDEEMYKDYLGSTRRPPVMEMPTQEDNKNLKWYKLGGFKTDWPMHRLHKLADKLHQLTV